jgi:hypothetical protein
MTGAAVQYDTTLQLIDKALPVDQKALSYAEMVFTLPPIKTADDYLRVGEIWKSGKQLLKEIDAGYDDIVKAAHQLHKQAVAKKAKYYTPVDMGVKAAKSLMSAYDAEQERIRREEERRLAEIARKQEEERRLAEALAAEEEAKRNGATQEEAAREGEEVLSAPAYVPPVVLPIFRLCRKMEGGPVYRTVWSADCFDIKALCRAVADGKASPETVLPNMPTLNKMATALKNSMNVPGVRAVSKRV